MKQTALKISRCNSLPVSLRRKIASWFIKRDGSEFTFDCNGVKYEGHLDNYVEWVAYVTGQFYEYTYINLIKQLVNGGTALDVGANIGNHSLAFSQFFDRVYSVEPYPPVFERLTKKTRVASNIHPFAVGLSDISGQLQFDTPKNLNWGAGKISTSGDITVDVLVGDQFVRDNIEGTINFIKIDVEGHEPKVLAGLQQTIEQHRSVVMFEVNRDYLKNGRKGLNELFQLFPDDYQFASLSGQSSFPVQRIVAKAKPLQRGSGFGKITYVIAYGPERGLRLD
ncbi:FkbM family methyltransferase [Porticoccus sp. W117]|uniref:FkbM family methyltransferase n=1 Tax=Porticoccus sp. W117 TaxID=3054777 RepID=UPI002596E45F|nr:FkbM family methyltransferase [Porticoccus sp. W117]MDM3871325.1 FkbM family methyltransferase [Porticoccus sp. W117]